MDLLRIQFQSMPALRTLQELGFLVLSLAVVLRIGREAQKLLQGGSPDFITVLVEAVFAGLMVSNIAWFGTTVAELTNDLSTALIDQAKLSVFSVAYQNLSDASGAMHFTNLGEVLSLRTLLGTGSVSLLLGMMLAKVVVLDLLWPICFGLVLMLGVIALPVGLLPGMGGFTGWTKNLVEVALWPVVFAVLASLMTSAFGGYLETASHLNLQSLLLPSPFGEEAMPSVIDVLRFWALCLVYLLSLFASPLLAMLITRGTPVGLVAGAALTSAMRVVSSAVGMAAGPIAAPAMSSAFSGGIAKILSPSKTPSLDQRQNHPPRER